jgi:hypothetical protein
MNTMPKKTPAAPPKDYTNRTAFSVTEWLTDIYPMARARFYEEVKTEQIKTFKDGRLRKVYASEARDYPARKAAEGARDPE